MKSEISVCCMYCMTKYRSHLHNWLILQLSNYASDISHYKGICGQLIQNPFM